MDRRLSPHKRTVKRRLYGTTRPGSLLKQDSDQTDHWDVTLPGYLEIDLVSHSGASAAGEFIYMKNNARFAQKLRSDFHMTQRILPPVDFQMA
jgi:hypothetical protein